MNVKESEELMEKQCVVVGGIECHAFAKPGRNQNRLSV